MSAKPSILLVDDERTTREGIRRALQPAYDVTLAESGADALAALERQQVDVMLSDVRMPGMDGLELLRQVHAKNPGVVCILLTAYGNVETAVDAMKEGAADFLTKPVNLDHLELVLARALRTRSIEAENRDLRARLDSKFGMESILGNSPAMQPVFDVIRQAAPTHATVLIQGPSGTGKELVANAIHRLSPRANAPFVAVHCAALSPTLLESELFGHEKGAFTGAIAQRKGRFELANGGTLFLDEISEIDPSIQVKLLRVLEERRFERVGGDRTIEVDIRIVAATNRDLRRYVAEGKFREDLFYRLDVVGIHLPPLRERGDDLGVLAMHFLRDFARQNGKTITSISPEAMQALQRYDWPGNVRELRNVIEKMVIMCRGDRLTAADVPERIRQATPAAPPSPAPAAPISPAPTLPVSAPAMPADGFVPTAGGPTLADLEKERILETLRFCNGNRSKAARMLGISRRTLLRRLESWGMKGSDGFTLVEMGLVVLLLASVAALAALRYAGFMRRAEVRAAESDLVTISGAFAALVEDCGSLPGFSPGYLRVHSLLSPTNVVAFRPAAEGGPFRLDEFGRNEAATPQGFAPFSAFTNWNAAANRGWHGPYLKPTSAGVRNADATRGGLFPEPGDRRTDADPTFRDRGFFPVGDAPDAWGFPGEEAFADPWGNPYILQIPPREAFPLAVANCAPAEVERRRFQYARLVSAGPDGKVETPCFDADPRAMRLGGRLANGTAPSRGDDIVRFLNRADVYEENEAP